MASKRSASASKWPPTRSSSDIEHVPHRGEAYVPKQLSEASLGRAQVGVVSCRDPTWQGDARVIRVEHPGIDVEDGRVARPIDRRDASPRDRIGQEAEIRAAGHRDVPSRETPGRDRKL